MLGARFIFRVLMFLVSAGIISLLLVLLWYGLSRIFRWTWDAIEHSNSDFAVWFKSKFRNSEALPWLCRRSLHKWSKWDDIGSLLQERRCLRCGFRERQETK